MVNEDLLAYVKAELKDHVQADHIRAVLLEKGWSVSLVDEALMIAQGIHPVPPPPPPLPTPPPPVAAPVQSPPPFVPPLQAIRGTTTMPKAPRVIVNETPSAFMNPEPHIHETTFEPAEQKHSSSVGKMIGYVVLLMILVGIGGGAYLAYQNKSLVQSKLSFLQNISFLQKLGVFGAAPYTQENLVSGLLDTSSKITSNSYKVSASISVIPRDADAVPFSIQISNEEELRTQYANDYQRAQDVRSILQYSTSKKSPYPATLQQLVDLIEKQNVYTRGTAHAKDPGTDLPYSYQVMQGGKDFNLIVNFETADAITAIKKYQSYSFASSSTVIDGKKVTFTSKSSSALYPSKEPPKPYLVMLGEMMRFLPAEITASLSASAATDWSKNAGEWKSNVDATGDFGDLSYKIDIDALKKDDAYYFRVNNIPSLFGEMFASNKGKWIKISPTSASTTASMFNSYSYLTSQLPDVEKRYKQNREESSAFMREVAALADSEHLFVLKGAPTSETVDGRNLYRYDLRAQKDSILPFYKKMVELSKKYKSISDSQLFNDPGTIEYLQSDEFSQVFDYLDKNILLSVWTDAQGFPAMFRYAMRIIPPDTAVQLKDKQVLLTVDVTFSDINQPIVVEAPTDAIPVEDLISQTESNLNYSLDSARTNGRDARRIADLKQIQLGLELYFDAKNQYPTSLGVLAPEYISTIPKDPATGAAYKYAAIGNGSKCTSYHVGAVLEATNAALSIDSDAKVKQTCTESAASDFEGKSAACTSVQSSTDRCYDVEPGEVIVPKGVQINTGGN